MRSGIMRTTSIVREFAMKGIDTTRSPAYKPLHNVTKWGRWFMSRSVGFTVLILGFGAANAAQAASGCAIPALAGLVQAQLKTVVNLSDGNGGLFKPNRMWSAVVDRKGVLCSVVSTTDFAPSLDVWPGSRAIAIAKAGTANDFSNSTLALSTTNLYGPTQPGGSLWGLNNSNPFNPAELPAAGNAAGTTPGGIITFGGGVALYQNGHVVGGLGVSGDSSCADHAIAFRMRKLAGYDSVPSGVAPDDTDNIIYAPAGKAPTGFEQPHCFPSDLTPSQVENIPPH
jgi:uncharacterized protein GlcG (DUF336 family)